MISMEMDSEAETRQEAKEERKRDGVSKRREEVGEESVSTDPG